MLLLCAKGRADINQFSDILNRGVDPDIYDQVSRIIIILFKRCMCMNALQIGRHPLWYAVDHKRADLVHLLLENKADVNLTTINVTTLTALY